MTDDRYRLLFEHLDVSLSVLKPVDDGADFEWVLVNDSGADFGDLARESYIGHRVTELFPGAAGLGLVAIGQAALQTGESTRVGPFPYEDSRISRWISILASPLPNGEIALHITNAEEAQPAEVEVERYRRLEERMGHLTRSGHWRYNTGTMELHWSPFLFELFDMDPTEGPDYDAELRRIHPDDRAIHERFSAAISTEDDRQEVQYRIIVGDTTKHIRAVGEAEYTPDGQRVVVGGFQDVTAEVRAQEALLDRERRFRSVFDESPIGIHILDIEGNVLELNDAFAELYGLTPEMREAVLTTYNIFDDPQVVSLGLRWFFERAFAGEAVTTPIVRYDAAEAVEDLGVSAPNAKTRWVQLRLFPLKEENGPQRFTVGIVEDVTETYQAHLQDRRSRALFRSTNDGVVITDLEGTITDVNPAFTEITGWKPHEVIGRNPNILRSGEHDDDFYNDMWQTLAEHGRWRGEITNRAKNGMPYKERLTITTIHDPDGLPEGYVGVFTELNT